MISKKILIMGSGGYVGKYLFYSIKKNNKIYLFDKKNEIIKNNKKATFIQGNIFKEKNISRIPNVDVVFFLIGLTGGAQSLEIKSLKKYLTYNSDTILNFLKIARKIRVKKIIFTSTEHVYGDKFGKIEDTERVEVFPKNYYGLSKLLAEKMLYSFCKKNGINVDILRIPRIIALNKSSFLHTMIKSAVNKNKIYINNLNTKFNFIFMDDLISAMNRCSKNYSTGFRILNIFNNSKPENLSSLAFRIKKIMNKKIKILFFKKIKNDHNPKNPVISNKKTKKILNWEPRLSNNEIIKKIIKLYEPKN